MNLKIGKDAEEILSEWGLLDKAAWQAKLEADFKEELNTLGKLYRLEAQAVDVAAFNLSLLAIAAADEMKRGLSPDDFKIEEID